MNRRAPSSVQLALTTTVILGLALSVAAGLVTAQEPARAGVVPPASGPTLSPQEQHGAMLFFQRCSICHLPPLVGPANGSRLPFGPLLYGYMDNARNAARAEQVIKTGGPKMPGFQYGLQAAEITDVVAYLKSSQMKTPPQWFAEAMKRGPDAGRGGGPVD